MKAIKRLKTDERKTRPPDLVVVYVATGEMVAEVVRGKLQSAGIPAMCKPMYVESSFGSGAAGMGDVHVLVPKEFEAKARELLREDESEEPDTRRHEEKY